MQPSDILSLVISIIALATSLFVAYKQIMLAKHSNSFPVTIDMFREFRSLEFKQHLYYVLFKFPSINQPDKGIHGLPEETRNHVLEVCHFFDNLGVMVANKAVDEKLIISFLGGTALKTWEIIYPYIMAERAGRENGLYQEFFEHLIFVIKKNPPEKVIKKMSLKRLKE